MNFWQRLLGLLRPQPPEPPGPRRWSENLSVFGLAPELELTATLRVDDGTSYVGQRDTSVQGLHRMRFWIESPPTNAGWGCHLDLEAPGYISQMNLRYVLGEGDHELEPSVMMVAGPVVPTHEKRTGLVARDGKATIDEQGQWHPLGTTFFWAMQGWKWERDRMKLNAVWLKSEGFDYVRILTLVAWPNRDIDPMKPHWSDWEQVLAEVIDFLYDECGLRVELTVDGKGTGNDLNSIASRVAGVVANGRVHKVLNFEMVNEYDVGSGVEIQRMVPMARLVRDRVPNLIALSSPGSWDDLGAACTAQPTVLTAFTAHIDRGTGDAKWRQVRQGYDFKNVRQWVSSNEPPGPGSSVATNTNPLQLAMMRAVGVMCGGSAYVLHTGTGVFGDGNPHPHAGARPPNFWEIDNIDAICQALRKIDALLPAGCENWQVANTQWTPPLPVAPFQPHAHWEGMHGSGVNKAYSALAPDGRVIQMPIGVLHHVEMTASYPLRDVTVYDPISLQPLAGFAGRTFAQGEKMDLPGAADSMVAYIIHGVRA